MMLRTLLAMLMLIGLGMIPLAQAQDMKVSDLLKATNTIETKPRLSDEGVRAFRRDASAGGVGVTGMNGIPTDIIESEQFKAEISEVFGSGFCAVPKNLLRKMQQTDSAPGNKTKGEADTSHSFPWNGWVPQLVRGQLDNFLKPAPPEKEVSIAVGRPQSLQKVLFSIWFSSDPSKTVHVLDQSQAFRNGLDLIPFVSQGDNRLIYTIDCGGVLSAAINASTGLGALGLGGKLKAAASRSASRVIIRGIVSSPVLDAVRGNQMILPGSIRLDMLGALLRTTTGLTDDTDVTMFDGGDIVSVAKSDKSGFQGEGSTAATLSMPGIDGTSSSGLTVGRSITADQYLFYFHDGVKTASAKLKVARERFVKDLQDMPISRENQSVPNIVRLRTGIPLNLCSSDLSWKLIPSSSEGSATTEVKPSWKDSACVLEIATNGTMPSPIRLEAENAQLLGDGRKIQLRSW